MQDQRESHNDQPMWINPIGGLGDMLMLSGVLWQAHQNNPEKKYHLIRRTRYTGFFKCHPALKTIGFSPDKAAIISSDYWSMEPLGGGHQRPYQILARRFGLKTPIEEVLYMPNMRAEPPLLSSIIPWKRKNVLIAPASDSPRKCMLPILWHRLADLLRSDDVLVLQAGRVGEIHIKNCYSLLGLTAPHELAAIMGRCDAVITHDNFIMHLAHLLTKQAVVLWGPTNHKIYGYPGHRHMQAPKTCGLDEYDDCFGPSRNEGGKLYAAPCPHGQKHCVDLIDPGHIYESVRQVL